MREQYFQYIITSSNIIENLDQLQAIAVDNMGKIPNKNVECPLYKDSPYTKKELEKVIYITPLEDIYQLQLTFNIPDPEPDYAAQVLRKWWENILLYT